MRKSVFFILLATASMPALAAGPDGQGRGFFNGTRAERSERGGGDNGQRTERSAGAESRQDAPAQRVERAERVKASRVEQTQQVQQSSDQSSRRSSSGFSGRRNGSGNRSDDAAQSAPVVSRDNNTGMTNWRSRERHSGGRTSPTIPTTTQQTQSRYSGDHSGTNWRDRSRTSQTTTTATTNRSSNWNSHDKNHDGRRWSSNWRNDHRYNWRSYRSRYSSLFHLGRYYDPFGYGYRRFSIGYSLYPSYYNNSNFWLDDPWQYRLPPAYGPYRWIRYYNDALLVDTYTGEVVDVIYGFFW